MYEYCEETSKRVLQLKSQFNNLSVSKEKFREYCEEKGIKKGDFLATCTVFMNIMTNIGAKIWAHQYLLVF